MGTTKSLYSTTYSKLDIYHFLQTEKQNAIGAAQWYYDMINVKPANDRVRAIRVAEWFDHYYAGAYAAQLLREMTSSCTGHMELI